VSSSRRRLLLVTLVLTVGVATPSPAHANVRQEIGGDVPFYARINAIASPAEIYDDGEWVAIAFYRPPSCVRAGFNLLDFFDVPGAFACGPPTTDGFTIWRNGPQVDPAPIHGSLRGRGAVPVWFVPSATLAAGVADGVLTIGELAAMPSLLRGSASFFHETLHPTQAANHPMLRIVASGTLEDGRRFDFKAIHIDDHSIRTSIDFG
jgi:hypothetical protein